ncbi:hypothetical protein [Sphingobium sp. LB126]|uniref:hypothetical protein n=1 Tax=Sphingobium sp. LB126 TaxID=1983755 RepID=UPI0012FDADD7|nr:hypothetical protein [Sphingobium sp. LB126]
MIFTRELGQDRSGPGFTVREQNLVPVSIVVFAWAISKSLRRGHRLATRVALALPCDVITSSSIRMLRSGRLADAPPRSWSVGSAPSLS